MSALGRWVGRLAMREVERKYGTVDLWREIYGGAPTMTGESVTHDRALQVATVLACVRVIANGVAQVPWKVFRETPEGRRVARDHSLYDLVHRRPNRWQTSFAFRETLAMHALLHGAAYVWKGRVGREQEMRELVPLEPQRMAVKRDGDALRYEYRGDDGLTATFGPQMIWHLRGPSWNGWQGMDALRLAREAIGLSIATERRHSEMHKGAAQVSGMLSVDQNLSAEKYEFLSSWIDRHAAGGDRAHKPLILDLGAKYTPFGMTGVDAQHLETRKHQIEEICRAFGVLPIMVGHADKTATYASAEQMFQAHVVHTLSPWYERIEQSADVELLTDAERAAGLYTKFLPNGLMRGTARDRAEFYARALGAGGHDTAWMTRNEVRDLEEMDPVEGGDVFPSPEAPAGGQEGAGA